MTATATMTVTAPTKTPGELAYFTVEFEKSRFDEVCDMISIISAPSDVYAVENWKVWRVV